MAAPWYSLSAMHELFEQLEKLKNAEEKVALATLVNTRGTTPRKEGAKMLVGAGGRILGSVTIGGCVDAQVIEEAEGVLGDNAPKLLELNLGDEEAWEIGLTCGGTIEVFVEPVRLARRPAPDVLRDAPRSRRAGRLGRADHAAGPSSQRIEAPAARHGKDGRDTRGSFP